MKIYKPPEHLSASTREWWQVIVADFDLEDHHLRLLSLAGEAFDRSQQARETLATEGLFYKNTAGEPRAHPAVAVERDARIAYARLMRELDLDGLPAPDVRLPRIGTRT